MSNPKSLGYISSRVVSNNPLLNNPLLKKYNGDFIYAIKTNNIQLLEESSDNKISQKDAKLLCNYIAEYGTNEMMKKALKLGYKYDIETICNALNESKLEMCKLLLKNYVIKEKDDLTELTISFNIAVEEDNKKIISFLKKCDFYKHLDTSIMTDEALEKF